MVDVWLVHYFGLDCNIPNIGGILVFILADIYVTCNWIHVNCNNVSSASNHKNAKATWAGSSDRRLGLNKKKKIWIL